MTNMWDTVEANSWSRDFDYENYTHMFKKVFPQGTPFKEESYLAFCNIFESLMVKDFNADESDE